MRMKGVKDGFGGARLKSRLGRSSCRIGLSPTNFLYAHFAIFLIDLEGSSFRR